MARFDTGLFDGFLFDAEVAGGGGSVTSSEIKIGSFELQTTDITTRFVKYSAPNLELGIRAFPSTDGGFVETSQFRQTRFQLRGTIKSDTREHLEELMDDLRAAFADGPNNLSILFAGSRRYWSVYASGIDRIFQGRDYFNVTVCPWEIELVCVTPFGRSSGRETFSGGSFTSSPTVYEIPNDGTAPTDSIVELTITTAGTLEKFSWGVTGTGEIITIDNGAAFSDGDTIVINTEDKTVKKNGTEIEYSGLLPHMLRGENVCTLTAITGSGFTVAVNERHYRRYY